MNQNQTTVLIVKNNKIKDIVIPRWENKSMLMELQTFNVRKDTKTVNGCKYRSSST